VKPDIWTEIAARKTTLDARRPLAAADVARLDAWYDVELTYTSTAIEGNTLTRQETAIVLEKGLTVRGKPLKDHMEATDHRDAWHFVQELAKRGTPLRESDLRSMHQLVLARSDPDTAGRYSDRPRLVSGSKARFPEPMAVPGLMANFAAWLAGASATAQTAFEGHLRLVSIHPFDDGNGRTARLLMNLLLLRAGYPPLVIGPEERPAYLDALEKAQADGDRAAYDAFMAERLLAGLDQFLNLLDGR
jgi:Fic family protein